MDARPHNLIAAAMAAALAIGPAHVAWADDHAEASSNAYLQFAQQPTSDTDATASVSPGGEAHDALPQTGRAAAERAIAAVALANAAVSAIALHAVASRTAREGGPR